MSFLKKFVVAHLVITPRLTVDFAEIRNRAVFSLQIILAERGIASNEFIIFDERIKIGRPILILFAEPDLIPPKQFVRHDVDREAGHDQLRVVRIRLGRIEQLPRSRRFAVDIEELCINGFCI